MAVVREGGARLLGGWEIRRGLAALGFGAAVAAAAFLGGAATDRGLRNFYDRLEKPPFTPPEWLFGPVWTVLYVLIAISGYRVWRTPRSSARTRALSFWGIQLVLNGLWSPLFFGLERPGLALVDIALLLPAIGAYIYFAHETDRAAAYILVPYLLWVAFATALNAEIVRLNP